MTGLPLERYMQLSRDLSLALAPEDHALAGGFLHFCDEWDGLLIDQTDYEFVCCSCAFGDDYDPSTGRLTALAAAASGGDVKQAPAESPQSGDAKQRNAQPSPGDTP